MGALLCWFVNLLPSGVSCALILKSWKMHFWPKMRMHRIIPCRGRFQLQLLTRWFGLGIQAHDRRGMTQGKAWVVMIEDTRSRNVRLNNHQYCYSLADLQWSFCATPHFNWKERACFPLLEEHFHSSFSIAMLPVKIKLAVSNADAWIDV